jgi:VTC domain
MTSSFAAAVEQLRPVSLEHVQQRADLQTRLDRKYIVSAATAAALLGELSGELAVLEIDGLRQFRYDSVYFDTPALDSFHGAVHGRRRRFKVRTRSYLDSGSSVLEVKTAGGRGHTVKERLPYAAEVRDRLTPEGFDFLAGRGIDGLLPELRPTLRTLYRRTTVVADDGWRATLDTGLRCVDFDGRAAGIGSAVLIESKSPGSATSLDRALWARGHRPVSVSKYGTGMAAVDPSLPSNKWHRTLQTHFVPA